MRPISLAYFSGRLVDAQSKPHVLKRESASLANENKQKITQILIFALNVVGDHFCANLPRGPKMWH
jgi:hypothetical protein